ncbi:EamA family transporter RarD [Thalassobacillus pellis]|uniref:EamA family transporter RarD n=1 Tax=Thalassobacillus pellis TaxID=748008 RepID=UPI0019615431|nr:EamA family transporter RarD [Thalassobacillus pellis]MBM7551913.1 chloramphenicol-sensitive protein RarD [Thalassobacillus pellis]
MDENKLGAIYMAGAYTLWGFLPIYWKLVQEVSALAILGHRIVWSFVFMAIVVFCLRKWSAFKQEVKKTWGNKRSAITITLASIAISINWLTYIWAVNSDHVVEASLGYYINPLVSILLGMIFFKETFSRPQWLAFAFAAAGVGYMTYHFGSIPWVALLLAFSFGIYGLLKKTAGLNAMFGLTIETLIMTPIAAVYLLSLPVSWSAMDWFSMTAILLFGAGAATAIPLLLFAAGANRIPLSMVGFLQYIAPTIMLFIGVFLYHEPFTNVHLLSFILIWSGLAIYTYSRVKRLKKYEA